MEITEPQKKIIYDIAKIQTKDLAFIILTGAYEQVYHEMIEENYEVTMKEVQAEVRKQLNQWAKVKKKPELFGQLLDSTEKGWLRHHVFAYYMKHNKTEGLWAKLNMDEKLDKLNLN